MLCNEAHRYRNLLDGLSIIKIHCMEMTKFEHKMIASDHCLDRKVKALVYKYFESGPKSSQLLSG